LLIFKNIVNSFYEELEKTGLLQPLKCRVEGLERHSLDSKHFIAAKGMSSLVEYYLSKSGIWIDGFIIIETSAVQCSALVLTNE